MSIKGKTGLILLAFFILYSLISYGMQRGAIFESFQSLEDKEARKNLFRSLDAIATEIDRIESLCRDWVSIYETFKSSPDSAGDFFNSSFPESVFAMNRINLMLLFDAEGEMVRGICYDFLAEEQIPVMDALVDNIRATPPLLTHNPDALMFSGSGIMLAEPNPLLISSHPILRDAQGGGVEGYLIFGRFLSTDLVEEFSDLSEFEFELIPLREEEMTSALREVVDRLTADNPQLIDTDEESHLYAYTTAPDINGDKAFLVRSRIPRDILSAGKRVMGYTLFSILLAGIFMFFGLRLILQRVILSPISDLTGQIVQVGKTGDMSSRRRSSRNERISTSPVSVSTPRRRSSRNDEIGVMAKEFEGMLEKLAQKDEALKTANTRLEEDIKERQRLIDELENALAEVKTLSGMLPICSQCKKIRDDKGYWNQIESYIGKHSDAQFSHGICPDCAKELYKDLYEELELEKKLKQDNHGSS
jgi:sensor domain CHASE-containing protein